jgi:hypothetical protein
MFGKVLDACAAARTSFFWKFTFAQSCPLHNSIVCQKFWVHAVTLGRPYLCDPNLQSLLLLLRRSLARRLLRLLRANPRPGASSEGNVSPGATSGKKKKHEKGMTTGSSTRSGAKKGDARNPSDQDNVGSGADTMAAPKSDSKY